jgi:hypothetical protein
MEVMTMAGQGVGRMFTQAITADRAAGAPMFTRPIMADWAVGVPMFTRPITVDRAAGAQPLATIGRLELLGALRSMGALVVGARAVGPVTVRKFTAVARAVGLALRVMVSRRILLAETIGRLELAVRRFTAAGRAVRVMLTSLIRVAETIVHRAAAVARFTAARAVRRTTAFSRT